MASCVAGTMARYIVEARDLPGVIETSALFEGCAAACFKILRFHERMAPCDRREKAEQIKREGKLIGDREVRKDSTLVLL